VGTAFEGFKEEDIFVIQRALKHYRGRLLSFKENERVKTLGHGELIYDDINFDIGQLDELMKYLRPNMRDLGGKSEKFRVYITVIISALKQLHSDLIEMREVFRKEFPTSLLELVSIEDAFNETSRVLSVYEILRSGIKVQIKN